MARCLANRTLSNSVRRCRTLADNCRSHMMLPRLSLQHTGRANEPAPRPPAESPEAPEGISHPSHLSCRRGAGDRHACTVLVDPWVHSSTSLVHHTRAPPQTIADPINERSRPNVTMLLSARPVLAIPYSMVHLLAIGASVSGMRKGSHARTPSR